MKQLQSLILFHCFDLEECYEGYILKLIYYAIQKLYKIMNGVNLITL